MTAREQKRPGRGAPARLSEDQVRAIRALAARRVRLKTIAGEYGVSPSYVSALVGGRARPEAAPPRRPDARRKLTDAAVADLRRRRAAGETLRSLGAAFGVHPAYAGQLCRAADRRPRPAPGGRRLTAARVAELRRRAAAGEHHASLAAAFGISQPYVSAVVLGKAWREGAPPARLTPAAVAELRARVAAGAVTQCRAAAELGLSPAYVSAIVLGKAWASAPA